MLTFSDLISLLLTFFVMLFAMSNVKLDQWRDITDALSRTVEPTPVVEPEPVTAPFNIGSIVFEAGTSLDYLAGVLEEVLAGDELLSQSLLFFYEDRLVISVPSNQFFDAGEVILSDPAELAVFQISGVVRNIENKIVVEAHAAPDEGVGDQFDSRWEVSIARAASVVQLLKRSGVEQEIDALGYADTRYNSLEELDSAERNRLANRIDIIIYPNIGRKSP